jgi:hypothetical protein
VSSSDCSPALAICSTPGASILNVGLGCLRTYTRKNKLAGAKRLPVGLGAVLDGARVVPTDFGRSAPMPLSFFISDVECYSERVLVGPLVALQTHMVSAWNLPRGG